MEKKFTVGSVVAETMSSNEVELVVLEQVGTKELVVAIKYSVGSQIDGESSIWILMSSECG